MADVDMAGTHATRNTWVGKEEEEEEGGVRVVGRKKTRWPWHAYGCNTNKQHASLFFWKGILDHCGTFPPLPSSGGVSY